MRRGNKRGFLARMFVQHGGGKEGEWEMASVCGFHRSKQSLPQGPLLDTSNRPASGRDGWSSSDKLSRCISRVPSDTISPGRPSEDYFCNAHWELPL